MTKSTYSNLEIRDEHLSEDRLLMYVDGELSQKEADLARKHLEKCWTCRAGLEKIEETISLFVEFKSQVQTPLIAPPPKGWGGFRASLYGLESELAKPKRSWFRLSDLSPFQLRIGVASLATLVITALIWQLALVENISANELLDRSAAMQRSKIRLTEDPVVYQKIKVRVANSSEWDLEVWNDTEKGRSKKNIIHPDHHDGSVQLNDLSAILKNNNMDPQQPLSPESFKAWRSSLAEKVDEIKEDADVTLRTVNRGDTSNGRISEATLKFRSEDYHPYQQIFTVKTEKGDLTFELSEIHFEVVGLDSLAPNFFGNSLTSAEITKAEVPKTSSSPEAVETDELLGSRSETPPTSSVIASPELEVEVLEMLSNAKADLGEEISVKRESGLLFVKGLVESNERKTAILKELETVRQNPAVSIEIDTISEALAKRKSSNSSKPVTVENFETRNLSSAAENDLVEYFGNESEARRFASNTVSRSSQAMSHVYALRRLAQQFSASELKNLSPQAKAKWLGLVASHARSFVSTSEGLSRDLGKVFRAPQVSASVNIAVSGIDELPRAIESLTAAASQNDRLIRSSLTISASDSQFSALKAVQFWQSMKNAEVLAGKIASMK